MRRRRALAAVGPLLDSPRARGYHVGTVGDPLAAARRVPNE